MSRQEIDAAKVELYRLLHQEAAKVDSCLSESEIALAFLLVQDRAVTAVLEAAR